MRGFNFTTLESQVRELPQVSCLNFARLALQDESKILFSKLAEIGQIHENKYWRISIFEFQL